MASTRRRVCRRIEREIPAVSQGESATLPCDATVKEQGDATGEARNGAAFANVRQRSEAGRKSAGARRLAGQRMKWGLFSGTTRAPEDSVYVDS